MRLCAPLCMLMHHIRRSSITKTAQLLLSGGSEQRSSSHSACVLSSLFFATVLCADRVGQMTKTYNDIDAVTRLLEEVRGVVFGSVNCVTWSWTRKDTENMTSNEIKCFALISVPVKNHVFISSLHISSRLPDVHCILHWLLIQCSVGLKISCRHYIR